VGILLFSSYSIMKILIKQLQFFDKNIIRIKPHPVFYHSNLFKAGAIVWGSILWLIEFFLKHVLYCWLSVLHSCWKLAPDHRKNIHLDLYKNHPITRHLIHSYISVHQTVITGSYMYTFIKLGSGDIYFSVIGCWWFHPNYCLHNYRGCSLDQLWQDPTICVL